MSLMTRASGYQIEVVYGTSTIEAYARRGNMPSSILYDSYVGFSACKETFEHDGR
jgi:hypothetical protein